MFSSSPFFSLCLTMFCMSLASCIMTDLFLKLRICGFFIFAWSHAIFSLETLGEDLDERNKLERCS